MTVIRAGFDSSKDNPCGTTVVAGFIAGADKWRSIEGQWNGLLALAGLETFHLTEIKHRFGSNWVEVVEPFGDLLESVELRSISAILRDVDWSQQDHSPAYKAILPYREHAALYMLFGILAEDIELEFNNEPVAIVFDNDWDPPEKAGESVIRIHNAWRERNQKPPFDIFLKGRTDWESIPLQAADFLAGVLRVNPFPAMMLKQNDLGWLTAETPLAKLTRSLTTNGRGNFWSKDVAEKVAAIKKGLASSSEGQTS